MYNKTRTLYTKQFGSKITDRLGAFNEKAGSPLLLVELVRILQVGLDDRQQMLTRNVTHDQVQLHQKNGARLLYRRLD